MFSYHPDLYSPHALVQDFHNISGLVQSTNVQLNVIVLFQAKHTQMHKEIAYTLY